MFINTFACNPGFFLSLLTVLSPNWNYKAIIFKHFIILPNNAKLNSLTTQSRLLVTLKKKPFENNVGKGENACNQNFLLFPQCFLPIPKRISVVRLHSFCRLQMCSIWTSFKNLLFGEGLSNTGSVDFLKHCEENEKVLF